MKKPITIEKFMKDVIVFCNENLIAPSELGATLFNDRSFFTRLRNGISPRLEKVEATYDYMIEFTERQASKQPSGQQAAPKRGK